MAECRTNLHKAISFLYSKKHTKQEMMDTFPFIITWKKIKYLTVNLILEVKDFNNENFKPLGGKKESKLQCTGITNIWVGSINVVKVTILPKAFDKCKTIPMKIPNSFTQNGVGGSKIYRKPQKTTDSQNCFAHQKQCWRNYSSRS